MATKKATPEKTLALVCKCGDCAHWKIMLTKIIADPKTFSGDQLNTVLKCASCGDEHPVYFTIDPHENLHYEKV